MDKEDGKYAFKIFLITLCLFTIYLFISFIFSMYIPYVDLLLLVGFVWAFVEARGCEDNVYRWITLGGTAFILIVYVAVMHDAWK
ncbi:hypothetical protein M3215_20410 [Bacillus cytotoxicus]|uniref:Uncharacterized protein n=1 Tax=Bacillus cytotoxicus TaxID=580165 RepID=A0ACC6ACN1_9BACI|nr:hypothetical protein [Bacillus cytotoxicus]HDX9578568.1 hypothetical protein [Bacillus pseudomycoides]